MTLFNVVEKLIKMKRTLVSQKEASNGHTPIHVALKTGNIEVAMWIIAAVQNNFGPENLNTLLNEVDNVSI